MFAALSGLGLVLALAAQQPQTDSVTLGAVKIGDREIAMNVPAQPGPYGAGTPHIEWNGWSFAVTPQGEIGPRYREDGGWRDAALLYGEAAKAEGARTKLPVKLILCTRSIIVDYGRDGVVRRRQLDIEPTGVKHIVDAAAQMKALAEAATPGIELSLEAELDSDLVLEAATPGTATPSAPAVRLATGSKVGSSSPFGPRFVLEDIAPRINETYFDADDKVYRGPYAAVIVVVAGLTDATRTYRVDKTPVTVVSYYSYGDRLPKEDLGVQLFEVWRQQAAIRAEAAGLAARPGALVTGASLPSRPSVADQRIPLGTALAGMSAGPRAARTIGPKATPFSPEDAWKDPLGALPRLSLRWLGDATLMPTGGRAVRAGKVGDANVVLSQARVADLVAAKLGGGSPATALGVIAGAEPVIVFQTPDVRQDGSDLQVLGIAAPESGAQAKPAPSPMGVGDFALQQGTDSERGVTFTVTETGLARRGYAVLAPNSGVPLASTAKASIGASVRIDSADPIALQLLDAQGVTRAVVSLSGVTPVPAEAPETSPVQTLWATIPADGQWHPFSVDLSKLAEPFDVAEVRLGPPPYGRFVERARPGAASFAVAGLTFGASTGAAPADPPAPDEAEVKARETASSTDGTALVAALRDPREPVRLNALLALSKVKYAEAVAELAAQVRSASPTVAYLAAQALAFQDVPEAWAALKLAVERGPFDHNGRFAAAALAKNPDPKMAASLNTLMAARSWRARREGARAVGAIKTREAAVILIAMIQEVNPCVCLEVTQAADAANELVCRRLLWSAVNHTSQYVRAASFWQLIGSPIAEYRDEGYKGVRDEAEGVRLYLLRQMAGQPSENHRKALRLAVVDLSAEVRARALDALAVQPGNVELGEVQNALTDRDARVQVALLRLAKAKNLAIPANALEALLRSDDPDVAEAAKALRGGQ